MDGPVALISIDVESDYNSPQYEALEHLDELIALVEELGLPVTAFVEGQFFQNRRSVTWPTSCGAGR